MCLHLHMVLSLHVCFYADFPLFIRQQSYWIGIYPNNFILILLLQWPCFWTRSHWGLGIRPSAFEFAWGHNSTHPTYYRSSSCLSLLHLSIHQPHENYYLHCRAEKRETSIRVSKSSRITETANARFRTQTRLKWFQGQFETSKQDAASQKVSLMTCLKAAILGSKSHYLKWWLCLWCYLWRQFHSWTLFKLIKM